MLINPNEFTDRCEFGFIDSVPNETNGNMVDEFVPKFSRWFGWRNQTFNQQYQLLGVTQTDTKQIVVRHDKEITPDMRVRINDVIYQFVLFSPDNRSLRDTFDLLTLKEVEKP
ncbi:phage head closure protein [Fructobacillus fructosus]|uniref:phage head closure protein n=1 Tax=Fructobacillus fructosus TaxID=1631 RepID=UPI0016589748|nr:phage head closure protein [Fructobacillus fructosus]MBC9119374.1 phage head closure protein [Fructobacillus fructosus]MBD9366833.1 phage head closure protein [Leuconostoc mesenteroides]